MKDFNYKERSFKARKELKKRRREMVKLYKSGKTGSEIAKILKCSKGTPYHALKDSGIKTRPSSITNRKDFFNESFFDKIDTEEKSYWLGFITADGSLRHGKLSIQLAEKDISHLYKFRKAVKSKGPIKKRQNIIHGRVCKFARFTLYSVKLCNALKDKGLTINKVFTVKPYDKIPNKLKRFYYLGLFDGDGAIYPHRCTRSWIMNLVGNKYMVEGFRKFIYSKIKFNGGVSKSKKSFEVRYHGILLTKSVAFLLYKNSNIYLNRKKKLADKLLKVKHLRTNLPHLKDIFENKLPLEVA